ncbi:putative FMN-dependent luciferase-like monooxygenase [Arthrobacter sp. StoSoilB5]|uniref:putative FMN-dependent luciferase-like monooxygenase n=1 Tax=Arthrobacter sp. StoSoilB5 TaxID=2830992 RepID=UPI001CC6AA9E|nr:putative FMN-dependent luciferase-like monooxygenase [Arthrobacter sp. StoSoilB5]BCW44911.1 luciferase [Arthrobacter sp. StoSoilB5]
MTHRAEATKRIGFFTRLLDDVGPAERYRLALEQIQAAEDTGFDTAWVAQHHFNEAEGGLPAPLVFLAYAAARTTSIRLGTGIITLPLEDPLRVAEDTAVLDLISGGRLEVGVGTGGTPSSFAAFDLESDQRRRIFAEKLQLLTEAWGGKDIRSSTNALYPAAPQLLERLWQATFSSSGGERAGRAGDGLMLSRTQPREQSLAGATLDQLQNPIIDAYLEALPAGATPRILASRTLFVADDRATALRFAEAGLRRIVPHFERQGHVFESHDVESLIAATDAHVGTVEDVVESLSRDSSLERATDVSFQVHSIDPPHEHILRSIELAATGVVPALGWKPDTAPLSDLQGEK